MAVAAHVAHHIPGRVRLRVPRKRDDHAFFADIANKLRQVPSVRSVSTNPRTASVLVRYDGVLETLLTQLVEAGLRDLLDVGEEPPLVPMAEALLGRFGQADTRFSEYTHGNLNGRDAILVALIVAALTQFWRGQIFAPAITLLWYAAQTVGPRDRRDAAAGTNLVE